MILYLTHESRGTLKSFTLFITARAITNMNLRHIDKFEIKISRRDSCSLDNLECLHLQRTAKKCTKVYNARAQPLFSSLNLGCFRRGFLKLPTFSSRWFLIFSCSSHNLRFLTSIFFVTSGILVFLVNTFKQRRKTAPVLPRDFFKQDLMYK